MLGPHHPGNNRSGRLNPAGAGKLRILRLARSRPGQKYGHSGGKREYIVLRRRPP